MRTQVIALFFDNTLLLHSFAKILIYEETRVSEVLPATTYY